MLQKILESLAAKAAVTKGLRLGSLNNRDLFLLVLKAGKSKIKVLAILVPLFLTGRWPLHWVLTWPFLCVSQCRWTLIANS